MMNQAPAAPQLMNDIICGCCPEDCGKPCKCYVYQHPCTGACNCIGQTFASIDEIDIGANPLPKDVVLDYEALDDLKDT